MKNVHWRDSLFEEKSIVSLYRRSRVVTTSTENFLVLILFAAALFFWIILSFSVDSIKPVTPSNLVKTLDTVAEYGLIFASSILGFLIAGFSIVASLMDVRIVQALGKAENKDYNMPQLKFVMFSFMHVFINYLIFVSVCLVYLSLFKGEFITLPTSFWSNASNFGVAYWGLIAIVIAFISLMIFILLQLKSFIWNLYQVIILIKAIEEILNDLTKDGE